MTYPHVVFRERCTARWSCRFRTWHVVVMPTWHGDDLSEWDVSAHLTKRAAIRAAARRRADGRLLLPTRTRGWIAGRLRCWADRIDRYGAPKMTGLSFTFETGWGTVTNREGRGCPLWFYGDSDYERAHR